MPTLADIMGFIDARKRSFMQNVSDPSLFATRLGEDASEFNKKQKSKMDRSRSVMTTPEERDADISDDIDTWLNASPGGIGKVSKAVTLKEIAGKAPAKAKTPKREPRYPGIFDEPKALAREAASRVDPEHPLLRQLFGVSRGDIFDISQGGTRQGNITDRPFKAAKNPKGSAAAEEVMNPKNEKRLINVIDAAREEPELFKGMASWYTMDPMYQHFVRLWGDKAPEMYKRYNALTGMASPGSEVLTELNRGTAANMLSHQGRFDDFVKYAGIKEEARGANFPADLAAVIAHPYHKTSQALPMQKYLKGGAVDMGSAKVPSYIEASGVPETGFQTAWPVGDAHWSRIVGLPDARPTGSTASASVPEMISLAPWWREKVAAKSGLEAVPAQAVVWGAGSGATGVTSPIGAGKLELTAMQIGKAAKRLGVSPEEARDLIILGRAHAGFADPELLKLLAALSGAGALGAGAVAGAGESK